MIRENKEAMPHAERFTIAGGNPTLLVWGAVSGTEKEWITRYLGKSVEQIGFVDEGRSEPRLTMMGGELCINATLALASLGGARGALRTSGVADFVTYENTHTTTLSLALPYTQRDNLVLFEGIGYLCTERLGSVSKTDMAKFATEHAVPAFGVIYHNGSHIRPFVYVSETDSFYEESACGSGSIALHILTGMQDIVQPTGEVITVCSDGERIAVSAQVRCTFPM